MSKKQYWLTKSEPGAFTSVQILTNRYVNV
jgi:predicted RNA-binding protein with PUA-like domain